MGKHFRMVLEGHFRMALEERFRMALEEQFRMILDVHFRMLLAECSGKAHDHPCHALFVETVPYFYPLQTCLVFHTIGDHILYCMSLNDRIHLEDHEREDSLHEMAFYVDELVEVDNHCNYRNLYWYHEDLEVAGNCSRSGMDNVDSHNPYDFQIHSHQKVHAMVLVHRGVWKDVVQT